MVLCRLSDPVGNSICRNTLKLPRALLQIGISTSKVFMYDSELMKRRRLMSLDGCIEFIQWINEQYRLVMCLWIKH